MKKELLKLVKSKSAELTEPAIPNTFKDNQLAFEDHL